MQLRTFGRHPRFAGPAVTVKCHEDNALLKQTLSGIPTRWAGCWSSTAAGRYGRRWSVT